MISMSLYMFPCTSVPFRGHVDIVAHFVERCPQNVYFWVEIHVFRQNAQNNTLEMRGKA